MTASAMETATKEWSEGGGDCSYDESIGGMVALSSGESLSESCVAKRVSAISLFLFGITCASV